MNLAKCPLSIDMDLHLDVAGGVDSRMQYPSAGPSSRSTPDLTLIGDEVVAIGPRDLGPPHGSAFLATVTPTASPERKHDSFSATLMGR